MAAFILVICSSFQRIPWNSEKVDFLESVRDEFQFAENTVAQSIISIKINTETDILRKIFGISEENIFFRIPPY